MSQGNQALVFLFLIVLAFLMPKLLRRRHKSSLTTVKRSIALAMFLVGMGTTGLVATAYDSSFGLSFVLSLVVGVVTWSAYHLNIRQVL